MALLSSQIGVLYFFRLNPYDVDLSDEIFVMLFATILILVFCYRLLISVDPVKIPAEKKEIKRLVIKETLQSHIIVSGIFFIVISFNVIFSAREASALFIILYIGGSLIVPVIFTFCTYAIKKKKYLSNLRHYYSENIYGQIFKYMVFIFCSVVLSLSTLFLFIGFQNPAPLKTVLLWAIWIAALIAPGAGAYKFFRLKAN